MQWHIPYTEAREKLASANVPFAELMRHGTMSVELFAPRGADTQQPHKQDELYVVVAGHARFVKDANIVPCASGDVLFVEAGIAHNFRDMSPDFETIVIFYGPQGGEHS